MTMTPGELYGHGERGLLAAVLRRAVLDAAAGDWDARRWLVTRALPLLWGLAPDGVDAEDLHRRLLAQQPWYRHVRWTEARR